MVHTLLKILGTNNSGATGWGFGFGWYGTLSCTWHLCSSWMAILLVLQILIIGQGTFHNLCRGFVSYPDPTCLGTSLGGVHLPSLTQIMKAISCKWSLCKSASLLPPNMCSGSDIQTASMKTFKCFSCYK